MSTPHTVSPRKRPVNLTLSEDLVQEAEAHSGNLSATVEAMLTEYVARERDARAARLREAEQCCDDWNAVLDAWGGSFADDHSPL
ncbi:type II toxin-antitoxin system CcdA family antitoxin [Ottowia beijingensis]|jgi:antitoxin CcdA|uniref:Type II toxin-antitoxin system CcdA family antitoxin n=1 Tax=Ottowia beijingensis TaxID=1207057 RepID=A0A853IZ84_9BURK|nr:type II toxin-antitoxin system CcdA family antitoxin [Ottowia beijingensis]MBP7535558.1 type II toxin-antitoxin system CcdA family antitoxin [Ottowia sp.]MBP9955026.1 type II toxin-antitoxin system CcdA family antitoxin [Ottowia sp.]NZA03224.1 type II toxin-antitoxin system CcdA family antitoxin [Ottowia beijingensis]